MGWMLPISLFATGKGIGPTYTDKVSRNGMRVGDLLSRDHAVFMHIKERHFKALFFELL